MTACPAILSPTSRRLRRRSFNALRILIGISAVLVSSAVLLAIAAAWLWPDEGAPSGGWAARFALLRFYTRVFQMHGGLAALALSGIALLAGFWRSGIALFIASALALLPYAREYAPKPTPHAGPTIRVMSMNLFAINRDAKDIFAAIDQANADVIFACEVTEWSRQEIFAKLKSRYPRSTNPDFDAGEIVISRLPFTVDRMSHPSSPRAPLIFSIDGRSVAMYPVHTTSPGTVTHLMHNRAQTQQLATVIRDETRPKIVLGDFNFSQLTPNYAWLTATGLRSTHEIAGFGVGNTWGPKWDPTLNRLPGVRIDQMFLSRELTATSHRVGPYTGSDHRPIIADVGFAVATP